MINNWVVVDDYSATENMAMRLIQDYFQLQAASDDDEARIELFCGPDPVEAWMAKHKVDDAAGLVAVYTQPTVVLVDAHMPVAEGFYPQGYKKKYEAKGFNGVDVYNCLKTLESPIIPIIWSVHNPVDQFFHLRDWWSHKSDTAQRLSEILSEAT